MFSQHNECIHLFDKLKDNHVECNETLGMDHIGILEGTSPSASGATLLYGMINNIAFSDSFLEVVIKVFPVDCPFRYINNKRKPINNVPIDYGNYEPGTGLLLTDLFILPHLTQHVVTCYNAAYCNEAYQVEISNCTRQPINNMTHYIVPSPERCKQLRSEGSPHPLEIMNTMYYTINKQGPYESPARSDTIRLLMVEKCAGDLQGVIKGLETKTIEQIDQLLEKLLLMIFHTLLLFDKILGHYSHNDLGARNILFVSENSLYSDMFCRYNFFDLFAIDIPCNTIIPKIWDYAYVRFANADQYQAYYKYIDSLPLLGNVMKDRYNDVAVLLLDIDRLLKLNNIDKSRYNITDISSIVAQNNNTEAIKEYFNIFGYSDELTSQESNKILHEF